MSAISLRINETAALRVCAFLRPGRRRSTMGSHLNTSGVRLLAEEEFFQTGRPMDGRRIRREPQPLVECRFVIRTYQGEGEQTNFANIDLLQAIGPEPSDGGPDDTNRH